MWMDVDTALSEVPVNIAALIDDTDFKTREESVAYDQAGMDLVWNFVTTAGAYTQTAVTPTTGGDYDWASQGNAMYSIEIPASGGASINNDTEGFGWFTGFATGVLPWSGPVIGFRAVALNNALVDGGDNLDVNVLQISGDATAADNLQSQYDTTGLSGDTFPATQAQVGNITSGTAAINTTTVNAPSGFVITVGGAEVNDEDSTHEEDGVYHTLEDDGADDTDCYYKFNVGGNGVPVSVTWIGYCQGVGDSYSVWARNFSGPAWEQVGGVTAQVGTTPGTQTFDLTNAHVGTGANIGEVWLRFLSADGSLVATDRILCSYAVVNQSVGYANGAIWIDTSGVGGSSGAVPYVNGTADNPSDNLTDALTLSVALGILRFHITPASTVTLIADASNMVGIGEQWNLALAGQIVTNASVFGATVTGVAESTSNGMEIVDSHIGTCSMGAFHAHRCAITGDITMLNNTADYFLDNCYSGVAGTATPSIDFGAAIGATALSMRHYSGGIEIKNMKAGDTMSLEGHGQLVIADGCDAGVIAIRGHFTITDNVIGGFQGTISDDARYDVDQIDDTITANAVITAIASALSVSASGTFAVDTPNTIIDLTATAGKFTNGGSDAKNNMVIKVYDVSGEVSEVRRITDWTVSDTTHAQATLDQGIVFAPNDGVDTFVIYDAAYAPVGEASVSPGDRALIAAEVWDVLTSAHRDPGTMGRKQNQIKPGIYL